jgi:hypothetical protein
MKYKGFLRILVRWAFLILEHGRHTFVMARGYAMKVMGDMSDIPLLKNIWTLRRGIVRVLLIVLGLLMTTIYWG